MFRRDWRERLRERSGGARSTDSYMSIGTVPQLSVRRHTPLESTRLSKDSVKATTAAARSAGALRGSTTRRMLSPCVAPRSMAISS